jgi:hypothetical protein
MAISAPVFPKKEYILLNFAFNKRKNPVFFLRIFPVSYIEKNGFVMCDPLVFKRGDSFPY